MTKKLIRLTENDLHRIVKESANRILIESLHGTSKSNKEAYASIEKVLSRLNQAKRNLEVITGPVSMDASLVLHPGNNEAFVWDNKNILGDYINKAIEYIDKAQQLCGFRNHANYFDNEKLYDDHLHPGTTKGKWLNIH